MMKRLSIVLLFIALFYAPQAFSQTLVHYWNFNNSATESDLLTPTSSLVSGAGITHIPGSSSAIVTTGNTTGQGFETTNPNARNGDAAGAHLRFNNPIGGTLVFALPTTGYEDIIIKYGTRRSGSGAGDQIIEYTTDGNTWISFGTINPQDANPVTETLDFSAITAANNNPKFKIRYTFAAGAGGTVGNNRFDNFTVDAKVFGSSDVTPPAVTITPADGSTGIDAAVTPIISFDEAIRLINNAAIDNTNVDNLVELRLNNASGIPVAFDATISGNEITITPASALLYNQTYYVALKANVVEDMNNNAVAAVQSSGFTTIAQQGAFAAGDMVIVAYRMNATGEEDAIAVLTLVDILPGTIINFTDSKYTDNTPAQCADGLVWTSPAGECMPAGSVFEIQPNVPMVSKGTISGSTFGLSSSGDQVIAYTGSNTSPHYITAISSNGWATSNSACGGSVSKLPAGLVDGQSALNTSTAPGNTSGNTVNGYYNGPQTGTAAQLRTSILNPANWEGIGSGTAAQTWPAWAFPGPVSVSSTIIVNQTTLKIVFNKDLDNASATNTQNFTGWAGLTFVTQTSNGSLADTLTLTFSTPFTIGTQITITVSNIQDKSGSTMQCPYSFTFTYNSTGIEQAHAAFCKVYPNPSAGQLYVEYTTDAPAVFEVYDISGKLMLSSPINTIENKATINTGNLENGVYFYTLSTNGNSLATGKLMIIK